MFSHVLTATRLVLTGAALVVVVGHSALSARDQIPSDEGAILHAVERLTFGATQEDVARARRMGLSAWIAEQIDGPRRPHAGLDAKLADLTTIALPSNVIAREYFLPARRERVDRARRRTSTEAPHELAGSATAAGSMTESVQRARERSHAQQREARVLRELAQAKILRAVYSEQQLEEMLVDFWFNHFNVFAGKGQTRVYLTEYEREAIRPLVFGRFRDLLEATAKSPAMLFYLDAWMSRAPEGATTLADPRVGGGVGRRGPDAAMRGEDQLPNPPGRRPRGLNENYARELLELHTLGVDGPYTQEDVVEVARALTGWTMTLRRQTSRNGERRGSNEPGSVRFVPALHDAGEKRVLGHTIRAGGGESDAERVFDILADHPSTAGLIAFKLARRFVSDTPPPALVDRAAARFRESKGDLREVVRSIVTSPEFFAPEARGAKVKTPFEFVVSTLRVADADVDGGERLVRALRELGMPLYFCQPPTGYDDTASTWVSSGGLVNRMNFALELASGRISGVTLPQELTTDLAAVRTVAAERVLMGRGADSTLATLARSTTPAQTLALAIGAPEFQRK